MNIYQLITVSELSITPKYLQVAGSILKGVEQGHLKQGDVLPSINDLSYELDLAKDTVEKAYKHLKGMGTVASVHGKGYFITGQAPEKRIRVFLLFNKLSPHKKIVYDAFAEALGAEALIDFYIYNNDYALFKKLLSEKKEGYTHYVIIPHFVEGGEGAAALLNAIPKHQLILLDKLAPGVSGSFGAVYERFREDIYKALQEALEPLAKYQTLKIVFPEYTYHPREILEGFSNFCRDYAFACEVIPDIALDTIREGTAYISLMEDDLVVLIEKILDAGLAPGEKVGVISYNDTPLKKIILNGITTISTDFHLMGKEAARLVMEGSTEHIPLPFYLTMRRSL
jgi:DNA-binding transcriptional regulator YhcF (GntR family)